MVCPLALTSCGQGAGAGAGATATGSGARLMITTVTTGLDPDTSGYTATLQGRSVHLDPNGDTTISDLAPGLTSVELSGAEPNCAWHRSNRPSVELIDGGTASLELEVNCVESVATLRIVTVTWGKGTDPDGYRAELPDRAVTLPENGFSVLTLHTGTVQFDVTDIAPGCRSQETTPVEGTIVFGVENTIQVDLLCGEPEQVAFTKSVSQAGAPSVFLVTLDGSDTVRQSLVDFSGGSEDSYPTWSPDGTAIIYQIKEYPGFALFRKSLQSPVTTKLSTNQFVTQLQPDWSLDGLSVVYTSSPLTAGGDPTNLDIYLMDPDGNNIRRVTSDTAVDERASLSPDGTSIAFVSNRSGNRDIYVMSLDGTGLVNLTDDPADDDAPRWSPDGTRLAFASNRLGNYDIFVMNRDGTGLVQVTEDIADDLDPAWARGGKKLAFVSARDDNACMTGSQCRFQLYVMNLDGSGVTRITTDLKPAGTPVWKP